MKGQVLDAEPMRAGKARARGRIVNTTRTGNTKTLERPTPEQFGNQSYYGPWLLGPLKTLINVTEGDLISDPGAGSWVVTLKSRVKEVGTFPAGTAVSSPLVAVLQMGQGAIQQIAEVDAYSNVISVPADVLRVSVGYQQLANSFEPGIPALPEEYYDAIEVSATCHWSSGSTNKALPTRSYYVVPNDALMAVVPVPPFAVEWCYVPFESVEPGVETLFDAQITTAPRGAPVDQPAVEIVISSVLASMGRMHCFRPLPPGAEQIRIRTTGDLPLSAGTMIYRIGL